MLALGMFLLIGGVVGQVITSRSSNPAEKKSNYYLFLETACTLAKEIGVAFLVGLTVRQLIEARHQKDFEDELRLQINRQLTPAVESVEKLNDDFGVTLRSQDIIPDPGARKELNERVLRPDWIRRNYQLRLQLFGEAGSDIIRVTTDTRYIAENVSQKLKYYEIHGWIDTARDRWIPQREPARFTFLTFGYPETFSAYEHRPLRLTEPVPNLRIEPKGESLNLTYPVNELPVPPKGLLEIKLTAEQYMHARDQFVWNMFHITDSLSLEVELAGSLNWGNFSVSPQLMHHQTKFAEGSPEKIGLKRIWRLNNILLPYQGVDVWWGPGGGE